MLFEDPEPGFAELIVLLGGDTSIFVLDQTYLEAYDPIFLAGFGGMTFIYLKSARGFEVQHTA